MYDDGTNGDAIANDNIYSCYMPFASYPIVKFYLTARNSNAMILSPERAEYEFYKYYSISGTTERPLSTKKELLYITDLLGKKCGYKKNTPLMFIYDDGSVEKKFFIK